MEESHFKQKKKVSPQVVAIRNLCDTLSRCLETAKGLVKKQYQHRYIMFLGFISNYRSLLNKSEDKLSSIHYPWYLKLYNMFFDDIPFITDEECHGKENQDFMLNQDLDLWIGKGTQKESENYRIAIGFIYRYAIASSNKCLKNYGEDSDIDPKLQLEYLVPWEIKFYLMEIICYAIEDKNPKDEYLQEMKEITAKLKVLANLTEEQARENAKRTVSGFAKGAANMVKALGLKDKDGNPISGDIGDASGITEVVSGLMNGDLGEALSDAFSTSDAKTPDEQFETTFDKIIPVVKKSMLNIKKPNGLNEKEGEKDATGGIFSKAGTKKLKKGLSEIQKAFNATEEDDSSDEKSREENSSSSSSD